MEDFAENISNASWDTLWQEMQKQLDELQTFEDNEITASKRGIEICNSFLEKLRDAIAQKVFASRAQEIYFFKQIKPNFYCRLIFYSEIFNIQTRKPIGDKESVKKYFQKELFRLRILSDRYNNFYEYYRSASNHLDDEYFRRGSTLKPFTAFHYSFDIDRQFSTGYDHIVAIILSNDLLAEYIAQQIKQLDAQEQHRQTNNSEDSLTWTATIIYLVELVYALYAFSPFNNTKVNPTRIMKCLCAAFNIQINSLSKKFEEIRIRKKNRIVFLNLLINALQRQMEEDDLNAL